MQIGNVNVATTSKQNSVTQATTNGGNFGDVFSKIIAATNTTNATPPTNSEGTINLQQLTEVLGAESMEEVLDLLGISHDEGLLTVQTSEGQDIPVDELLNVDNLFAILNIEPEQLNNIVQQILGDENVVINDVWELVNLVNEQAPNFMSQISNALKSEHKVTPKEAEKLLQLLKLTQLTGKNSDLLANQSVQLSQLKELFQSVSDEVPLNSTTQATQTHQITQTSTTGNVSLQGFQQVVHQVVKQTEITESSQTSAVPQQTTTVTTKTVTITLPTEKTAQSEALIKEIQTVLNRSQISNTQGTMKILLKLYPENLGSIRIELMQKDGVLSARLLASTPVGKELLDSQLHQLKSTFVQQNIQLDRIDIAQALHETDRNLRDQSLFGNLFKQHSDTEETSKDDENEDDEKISFSEYLINEEV